MINPHV
jgi:thyroid adenoma-associated protein